MLIKHHPQPSHHSFVFLPPAVHSFRPLQILVLQPGHYQRNPHLFVTHTGIDKVVLTLEGSRDSGGAADAEEEKVDACWGAGEGLEVGFEVGGGCGGRDGALGAFVQAGGVPEGNGDGLGLGTGTGRVAWHWKFQGNVVPSMLHRTPECVVGRLRDVLSCDEIDEGRFPDARFAEEDNVSGARIAVDGGRRFGSYACLGRACRRSGGGDETSDSNQYH